MAQIWKRRSAVQRKRRSAVQRKRRSAVQRKRRSAVQRKRRSAVQTTLGAALLALAGAVCQTTPAAALSLAPVSTVGETAGTARTALEGATASVRVTTTSATATASNPPIVSQVPAAAGTPTVRLQARPLSVQAPGLATTSSSATVTPPAVTIEPPAVPSATTRHPTTIAVTPPPVTVRTAPAGPTVQRLAPDSNAPAPAVRTPKAQSGKSTSGAKAAPQPGPSAPARPTALWRHPVPRAVAAGPGPRAARQRGGAPQPLPSASSLQTPLAAAAGAARRAHASTGAGWLPPSEVGRTGGGARSGSAPVTVAPSDKPLLDVGLPVEDLRLLLLIPLVGIGLLILTVLAGARRGPFERYHGAGLAVWLEHPQQLLRSLRWKHLTRRG
jgi:hypothetical protein